MRIASLFPVLMSMVIPLAGLGVAAQTAKPDERGTIVAVYPPWWSADRALSAASDVGHVRNSGLLPFVYFVQSTQPDLPTRLRRSGAIWFFNPPGETGCGPIGGEQNV